MDKERRRQQRIHKRREATKAANKTTGTFTKMKFGFGSTKSTNRSKNKPKKIIFDLDGTLWYRSIKDKCVLRPGVKRLLAFLANYKFEVFFFTAAKKEDIIVHFRKHFGPVGKRLKTFEDLREETFGFQIGGVGYVKRIHGLNPGCTVIVDDNMGFYSDTQSANLIVAPKFTRDMALCNPGACIETIDAGFIKKLGTWLNGGFLKALGDVEEMHAEIKAFNE